MRKILINFFTVFILLVICSCANSGGYASKNIKEEPVLAEVKSLLVDGATLNTVRPSENELSEEEIAVKLANTVAELGYYNTEFADEIDPQLKYCKVEAPEYIYSTNPNSHGNGGYVISAVDDNGFLVATVTCNAEADREKDNFIGSYGSCTGSNVHSITKREVCEILNEELPNKKFTEPVLVDVRLAESPFYDAYWYVATIDESSESVTKSIAENPEVVVEEYLIGSAIRKYVPSKNGISKSLDCSDKNVWDGIRKVDGELEYYKVIEANKTVIDYESKNSKALNSDAYFLNYRGKKLSSLYFGAVKTTKI